MGLNGALHQKGFTMAIAVSHPFDNNGAASRGRNGEGPPPPAAELPDAAASMGDAVTPHALITGPTDWRFLLAGIDTLDLGFYVDWGPAWNRIQPQLTYEREQSIQGVKRVWRSDGIDEAIVTGSSKRNYKFRVRMLDLNMWIADLDAPKQYPNVFISPSAKSLWTDGPVAVIEGLRHLIESMGGVVREVKISRCDLAADFAIPEGLSLDFLRKYLVSRTRKTNHHEDHGVLETFYVGKRGAPIQARIYNKLLKISRDPAGQFFFALWGGPAPAWRVEYQLNRSFLYHTGINTTDDLIAQSGGLWSYLTDQWLSLRENDSQNTRRRTVHPWWRAVQGVAEQFGPACTISRGNQKVPDLAPDWYISHMSGCLVSLAARQGKRSIDDALANFNDHAKAYWKEKSWEDAYDCKRIACNLPTREEGGEDVPF